MTARGLGLIGTQIEHSGSPALFRAAANHFRDDTEYRTWPLAASELDTFLRNAPAMLRGFNVTAPFKRQVATHFAAVCDSTATRLGAVNLVLLDHDGAIGAYNTDVLGLMNAWRADGILLDDATLVLFGAGGAARAVVAAAHDAQARRVYVIARRAEAADAFLEWAAGVFPGFAQAGPPPARETIELAVVASSAWPRPSPLSATPLPRSGIYDLRTIDVVEAAHACALSGIPYTDGRRMLFEQAILGVPFFFEGRSVTDDLRTAMQSALTAHFARVDHNS